MYLGTYICVYAHVCVCRYIYTRVYNNEIGGHQFEKEQGGKVEGLKRLKRRKGKSEMM